MKRLSSALLLSACLVLLLAAAASAQQRTIRVYNWSDYIDESVLSDFTEATGVKVVYDVYDSNEILQTKLLAGKIGYDLVFPSGNFLVQEIKAGVFRPLDRSKTAELEEPRSADHGAAGGLRSRQQVRHPVSLGHDRHRLQRRHDREADAGRRHGFLDR